MIRRVGSVLARGVGSLALGLLAWQLLIEVAGVTPYIAKGPIDVYDYLFQGAAASHNRQELLTGLLISTRDAVLGFVVGTLAAVVLAVVFTLSRQIEQSVMPVALALRTVPLVAMVPVIALAFGRGLVAVTVISGIVTFFPTLVNVTLALRATPRALVDLMRVYGAGQLETLWKVRLPTALPSLFASARIAAPLAFSGAVLAEWLATGDGLGDLILASIATSEFARSWAAVFVVITASVLFHRVIVAAEAAGLERLGWRDAESRWA